MPSRNLGKSGLALSEAGLGCWQFGGGFGPIDDETVSAILRTAVSEGIRFFDTADVYGAGRSELLIGEFLRNCAEEIVIATKVGRDSSLFPAAEAAGVGIVVRLPLASGLLAGKFSKRTQFEESDHRNFNRDGAFFNVGETFAGLPFERGVELADLLKPMVPESVAMAQWAQRWILDQPAVTSVITGASRPEQVKANAAVSSMPQLSPSRHESLAAFYHDEVHPHIRGPY